MTRGLLLGISLWLSFTDVPLDAGEVKLLPLVVSHYDHYLEHGLDTYGRIHTANWMASLDIATKRYPASDFAAAGKRIYRQNPAPKGATLFWDIPQIRAALRLTTATGNPKYAAAARAYARAYLDPPESRTPDTGLWKWGAHWYYRAFDGPDDDEDEYFNDRYRGFSGSHHEMRPYTPDWQFFWELEPAMTAAQIHLAGEHHVVGGYESATGQFSRHDTFEDSPHAFLDSGAVLVESLTWLAKRGAGAEREKYLEQAKKIARYSHRSRNARTGLIRNNQPNRSRWDYKVSTSEVGVWGAKLLRAAEYSGDLEYLEMARDGIYPWLQYAWHAPSERYWGKVNVEDGEPSFDASTPYQPLDYSSPWNVLIPSHDCFLGMAEALTELHQWAEAHHPEDLPKLELHIRRMSKVVMEDRPALNAKDGIGAYAEAYGCAISFLLRAGERLKDPEYRRFAERIAHEAVTVLYARDMFRTHGGEDRYDAVDGFGFLAEALMELGSYHAPLDPVEIARFEFGQPAVDGPAATPGPSIAEIVEDRGEDACGVTVVLKVALRESQAAAAEAGDYLGFVVRPPEGRELNLSHVQFSVRQPTGSGRRFRYFLRSSRDGFVGNLAADELSGERFETYFVSLIDPQFQRCDEPVEFRLYFYGTAGGSSEAAMVDRFQVFAGRSDSATSPDSNR